MCTKDIFFSWQSHKMTLKTEDSHILNTCEPALSSKVTPRKHSLIPQLRQTHSLSKVSHSILTSSRHLSTSDCYFINFSPSSISLSLF